MKTALQDLMDRMTAQTVSKMKMQEAIGIAAPEVKAPQPAPDLLDWEKELLYGYSQVPTRVMRGAPEPRPRRERAELDFTNTYMRNVHNPDLLLGVAQQYLEGVEFDTLVGTGLSGTIAVTELARRLGKKYLVVRKPNDSSHSRKPVEGKLGKRWIFVDDLIASGTTFCRVWDAIHVVQDGWSDFSTEFVGSFLYGEGDWGDPAAFVKPEEHGRWLHRYASHYDGRYGNEPAW